MCVTFPYSAHWHHGSFLIFHFQNLSWMGAISKVVQADGFWLSHLNHAVLEFISLSLLKMTQEGKRMFTCLVGIRESISGFQWTFQIQVNPSNPLKKRFVFEGVSCAALGYSCRDKDHCWQWRCPGNSTWLHRIFPKGSSLLQVFSDTCQCRKVPQTQWGHWRFSLVAYGQTGECPLFHLPVCTHALPMVLLVLFNHSDHSHQPSCCFEIQWVQVHPSLSSLSNGFLSKTLIIYLWISMIRINIKTII